MKRKTTHPYTFSSIPRPWATLMTKHYYFYINWKLQAETFLSLVFQTSVRYRKGKHLHIPPFMWIISTHWTQINLVLAQSMVLHQSHSPPLRLQNNFWKYIQAHREKEVCDFVLGGKRLSEESGRELVGALGKWIHNVGKCVMWECITW